MKLIHTSDLHLGKTIYETSLLADQQAMLNQLCAELEKDDYAALIISGDIYDRTIPPAEAVELFSGFLGTIRRKLPELAICIIPGNHDSAQRLSFADEILGEQHIHIVSKPENSFTPIIITKKTESAALFLLPFLSAGSLKPREKETDENNKVPDLFTDSAETLFTQTELAAEASRRFSEILVQPELSGIPTVLAAHLFTSGGQESDSERVFVGAAERVNPALFSQFSYVALGHLHRFQKITDAMYYAGSPLAYSFGEAGGEKYFLRVEIDTGQQNFPVQITPIPVQPLRTMTKLEGTFEEFYSGKDYDRFAGDYLEITLTDPVLIANPVNLLRPKFPYLLSLKQGAEAAAEQKIPGEKNTGTEKKRDPAADFTDFEEMLYGAADSAKTELFSSLLEECTDAS
ncbi:exonuclease subunit SbcD [Brucepastera parasyntrophica]|uniref:exonuclease SbcCD subunit D n=1 Tax=Brucepastera parasyntrophica TaxID=2880008 RepID=UPI00210915BD|nr:exonuclease SbcCD subunit D [Brucepastera parasyntrophica]ULQ59638.1 exonuclease subunit SbcD [Brucepastera parasyntrophica]